MDYRLELFQLLFSIEMISAFIIVNISNIIILPKGLELGLLSIPRLFMAISISLLLTGPGRFSIEWNSIKRELVLGGKEMLQSLKWYPQHDPKMIGYEERDGTNNNNNLYESSSLISLTNLLIN